MNKRDILSIITIFLIGSVNFQSYSDILSAQIADQVQNADEFGSPYSATAPTIQIIDPVDNIELKNNSQIFFTVDPEGDTIDTVWYVWDETADVFPPGESPFTIGVPVLEDGPHTLTISANNSAGESRSLEHHWLIDNLNPQIMFSEDLETKNGNIFEFFVLEENTINSVFYHWNDDLETLLEGPTYSFLVTGLIEGLHTLHINAIDNATNMNPFQEYEVIIDETEPDIALHSATTIQNSDIIDLGITDANTLDSTFYNWNHGENVTLESPYDISTGSLAEGPNDLYVFAYDVAGNFKTQHYAFTVDDAPIIELISSYNNSEIKSSKVLNFTITDFQLAIDTVFYNWNGGVNTTLNSPYDIVISGITDGAHQLNIYANDSAGKISCKVYNLIIDDIEPKIELDPQDREREIRIGEKILLNITEANTLTSILYRWGEDSEHSGILTAPYEIFVPILPEGDIELSINAWDEAKNFKREEFTFTIDSVAPSITLLSPKEGRGIENGALIDLLIEDGNTIDIVIYNWNGGSNITLESPYDITFNEQGSNDELLYIFASDKAGNSISAFFNFTVDESAPSIRLLAPDKPFVYQSGTLVEISITDPLLESAWFHWDTEAVNYAWTYPYTTVLPNLEGNHFLYVYANDTIGNIAQETFAFTVDNLSPNITLTNPSAGGSLRNGSYASFTVEDHNDLLQVFYNWNNGTNITITAPYEIFIEDLVDGTNILQINAQDQANNWANASFEIFLDTAAPLISLKNVPDNSILQPLSIIEVEIIEPYLQNVSYAWDNSTEIPWQGNYQTLVPLEEGVHVLNVFAVDDVGNVAHAIFNITSDNTAPTISLANPSMKSNLLKNTSISLAITDNFGLSAVYYNWDGGENVTLNGTYVVYLPPKTGSHVLQVYAQDEAGNWVVTKFQFTTKVSVFVWISLGALVAGSSGGGVVFFLKKKKKTAVDQEKLQDWFKDHGYKLT